MKNNNNERICKTCSDCSNCFPKGNCNYKNFYCLLYRKDIEFFSYENIYRADACEHFKESEGDENSYRLSIYMT